MAEPETVVAEEAAEVARYDKDLMSAIRVAVRELNVKEGWRIDTGVRNELGFAAARCVLDHLAALSTLPDPQGESCGGAPGKPGRDPRLRSGGMKLNMERRCPGCPDCTSLKSGGESG